MTETPVALDDFRPCLEPITTVLSKAIEHGNAPMTVIRRESFGGDVLDETPPVSGLVHGTLRDGLGDSATAVNAVWDAQTGVSVPSQVQAMESTRRVLQSNY